MGNKIKMFVSDMDGTLLGLDLRISEFITGSNADDAVADGIRYITANY